MNTAQPQPRPKRFAPLWVMLGCTLWTAVLIPTYLHRYGPANLLWFSDIALIGACAGMWLRHRLIISMMALSVTLLEMAWNLGFFVRLLTGRSLFGLAEYMFAPHIHPFIRGLSLFHVWLPPLLIWMILRNGYDRRALRYQTGLAWIVLPLSFVAGTLEANINWVHGFGSAGQTFLPPPAHLALLMIGFPLLVYLPTHLLLRPLAGQR